MITVSQSSLSTDYVQIQITTTSGADPTGNAVQFAFILSSYPEVQPTLTDWHTGSWITLPGPAYWAQCLVGPANGGVNLAIGRYLVWLKITANPEVPVLQQVFLEITP